MMYYPGISIIAAVDRNKAIGRDNQIPWRLSSDMKYFKSITMGKTIVMGRNTFASLNYRQLPGRHTAVVSSDPFLGVRYGVDVYDSLEKALADVSSEQSETMIIGGSMLYHAALEYASKLYITQVDTEVKDADAFFPSFEHLFSLISEEKHTADEKNEYDYSFRIFRKNQNR
jgi:dihydrofolate reductase